MFDVGTSLSARRLKLFGRAALSPHIAITGTGMRLADPSRLTLFPPARWAGRTAVVEIEALARTGLNHMADEDFDALEHDLRAIIVRRLAALRRS